MQTHVLKLNKTHTPRDLTVTAREERRGPACLRQCVDKATEDHKRPFVCHCSCAVTFKKGLFVNDRRSPSRLCPLPPLFSPFLSLSAFSCSRCEGSAKSAKTDPIGTTGSRRRRRRRRPLPDRSRGICRGWMLESFWPCHLGHPTY